MFNLAMSVNNLAIDLAEAGRHEDAVALVQEGAGYFHELASIEPEAFAASAEQADEILAWVQTRHTDHQGMP